MRLGSTGLGSRSATASRSTSLARFVMVWVAASTLGACTEWLEVDDEDDDYTLPVGRPWVYPSEPALLEAPGPIVPQTPGLRVPLAGYWTRARLDAHDLLFPYTWGSLLTAADGPSSVTSRPSVVVLRLEALSHGEESSSTTGPPLGLRAVIPLKLPAGVDASTIRDGLELPDKALVGATIGLRTSAQDLWIITPTRLRFERVDRRVIVGSIEGEARRGAKGQRARRFTTTFIAMRAPDGNDLGAGLAAPDGFVPPDSGGPVDPRP